MKRYTLLLALLVWSMTVVRAQNEVPNDSLPHEDGRNIVLSPTVRNYGGFLLDLGIMPPASYLPPLTSFKIELPDASKDYTALFRPDTDVLYTSGTYTFGMSAYSQPFYWGAFPGNGSAHLQMGSFKLKNGWRLNTYGEYDKDGWRVPDPSALPWQKNNFKGAFELKSSDGSFGIRVEVRRGRENPF